MARMGQVLGLGGNRPEHGGPELLLHLWMSAAGVGGQVMELAQIEDLQAAGAGLL